MNIFFTADTHFFHKNIITYCNRPFKTKEEMNEVLISNWNKKITNGDLVYHLGDMAFCGSRDFNDLIRGLNGQIIWILGNHDKKSQKICPYRFKESCHYKEINIGYGKVILFHYPIVSWNGKYHNTFHFHGHTHNTFPPISKNMFDVGVDACEYMPLELEEIIERIEDRKND